MTKELIDRAWCVLPAEFKRVVKAHYAGLNAAYKAYLSKDNLTNEECDRCKAIREKISIYSMYFGIHNLISDAEGEEMLMCKKSRVHQQYKQASQLKDDSDPKWKLVGDQIERVLIGLFGSKCLPDDTKGPKLSEPKFTKGNMVHCKSFGYEGDYKVLEYAGGPRNCYDCIDKYGAYYRFYDSDLEPYTEPEEVARMKPIESEINVYLATKEEEEEFRLLLHENGFKWNTDRSLISLSCWSSALEEDKIHNVYPDKTVTYYGKKTSDTLTFSEFKKQYFEGNVNHRQFIANCDKQFDNILKDSFSQERRLNIAAMAMQGILSNPQLLKITIETYQEEIGSPDMYVAVAKAAKAQADALLVECEKGGSDGN